MDMLPYFKSVVDQDRSPVLICDTHHTVVYMNPAAARRYATRGGLGLIGKSLMNCHSPATRHTIEKVLAWFQESKDHNILYESRNEEEYKDVYIVALRDEAGELIGYYEKHEYRTNETAAMYDYSHSL